MITLLSLAVEEIYRGVSIAKTQGKKPQFTIEDDLVDLFDLPFDDNGALEDAMRKAAKKTGKKLTFASESSTFVARTTGLDTARWVIDTALDTATAAGPRN